MDLKDQLKKMVDAVTAVDLAALDKAAAMLRAVPGQSGKVIIIGNGASAAIASHVSVDLTKTGGVRAVNFNEADLITCFANDYGYEQWAAEALKSYADPGDLVILISSSGMSKNILNAAVQAKKMGLSLITLSGFSRDNRLRQLGEVNLWVDSLEYNVVETAHQTWLLALVDKLAEESKS
ncbi:MAG: SIS domain-containing protein [Candidatus Omnitrophica bacterium]|nr:SIS domain-containing protein [Candidatus Omnitrophota bacterium]